MKELNITIPEGHEIDLENSDLASGKIVFKPTTPKAWRYQKHVISGYCITTRSEIMIVNDLDSELECNHNVFATKKHAKAALAMAQISQIMANDERFGGPVTIDEWEDDTINKYIIEFYDGEIGTDCYCSSYHFLAFHTRQQRDLFLEENRDLVEAYFMLN